MRIPFLTTSFSESGRQAKTRFANILNRNTKRRGLLAMTLLLSSALLCGILVGCGDATSIGIIGGADGPTNVVVHKKGNYTVEMHDRVSKAILEYNKDRFVHGDCYAEGHIILDTEETEGGYKVYTISTYGTYNFCGDHFEHGSGCGDIPTVLTFDKEHNLINYQVPMDGKGYTESIKELFPESWHACVLDIPENESQRLRDQKENYAKAYLKSVGKEGMPIGYYGDFH